MQYWVSCVLMHWVVCTQWVMICIYRSSSYYPHMPVGMLGTYRLLSVCFSVCLSAGFLVTDISGVGWRRAMKFCRVVDLGVHQVISPFGELWPRG